MNRRPLFGYLFVHDGNILTEFFLSHISPSTCVVLVSLSLSLSFPLRSRLVISAGFRVLPFPQTSIISRRRRLRTFYEAANKMQLSVHSNPCTSSVRCQTPFDEVAGCRLLAHINQTSDHTRDANIRLYWLAWLIAIEFIEVKNESRRLQNNQHSRPTNCIAACDWARSEETHARRAKQTEKSAAILLMYRLVPFCFANLDGTVLIDKHAHTPQHKFCATCPSKYF